MESSSSTSDIRSERSGGGSGGGGDDHKMCTSYEQNDVEHCKKDASMIGFSTTKSDIKSTNDIKSNSDNVDDIADGIGKVDISGKDTDKDSADKQAEVAEKEDQNYLISVQDEIISIFSEKRNHVDQHFRSVDMADPETMNHPNVKLFTKEVYRLINEEEDKNKKLFQASPPKEDCPICMLPMPFCGELDGRFRFSYQFCCGKRVCNGCIDASKKEVRKGKMKDLCPFCRIPNPRNDKDDLKRCRKRMKLKDAYAFYMMGDQYYNGRWGLPRHLSRACELWNQAAELGSLQAHCGLGDAYMRGAGVEQDAKKARYHFEVAAMGGHENARHSLGGIEEGMGNKRLAMHHIMFAARCGYVDSLKCVRLAYKDGCVHVTKDEYAATLRAYKESYDEMESVHRAASAAIRTPSSDVYALSPEDRAAHMAKYTSAFTRSEKEK